MTISQGIKTVFRDTVLITDDRLTILIIFIVIIIAYGIRSTIFIYLLLQKPQTQSSHLRLCCEHDQGVYELGEYACKLAKVCAKNINTDAEKKYGFLMFSLAGAPQEIRIISINTHFIAPNSWT